METVKITIPSNIIHNCQIVTGFLLLKEQGWNVEIVDRSRDAQNPFFDLPVIQAEYCGKKIMYDLWDGYQHPGDMKRCLDWCDIYFKRSFSQEKNQRLFPDESNKIYPLGFNYHITHRKNPINEPLWKALAKPFLGKTPDAYFVPEVFEGRAERKEGEPVKILFLTRLWDDQDPALDEEANRERTYINEARIQIIRTLREKYGDAFVGGLNDNALSRAWAPELIMPAKYTERRQYVKLLHSCDICIGTMGLFESIGWKTAEYVAAAKAIVNEHFHYAVTGDFREGENYIGFSTARECIDAVQFLVDDPEKLFAMKQKNEQYYREYLKPEVLVKNSLMQVKRILSGEEGKNN